MKKLGDDKNLDDDDTRDDPRGEWGYIEPFLLTVTYDFNFFLK